MEKLDRITMNPLVMGGKPCIRGLRITVGNILGLLASGYTVDAILDQYPELEKEDFPQILSYAAWRTEEMEVSLID